MDDREVRRERSGWRDADLSKRHRDWGFDCPAADIDFLMVEYNHALPMALIDYKLREMNTKEPNRYSATHQAIGKLANASALPYLVVFYLKNPWLFRLIPMNEYADQRLKGREWILSERNYVTWLYKLRGMPLSLRIAHQLSTYCPQKNIVAELEPLKDLVADVKQSALFMTDKESA